MRGVDRTQIYGVTSPMFCFHIIDVVLCSTFLLFVFKVSQSHYNVVTLHHS